MLTISPTLTPIIYAIKIDPIVIENVMLPANPGIDSVFQNYITKILELVQ